MSSHDSILGLTARPSGSRSRPSAAVVPVDPNGPEGLDGLEARLGYAFRDRGLLLEALTHMSFANENRGFESNERLEFLGDAVLGAAVCHLLMTRFPSEREGPLTRFKSLLVSENGLSEIGTALGLSQHLRLGRGEANSGGREKPSLVANAMEAVVAAVFLDGGFDGVTRTVDHLFGGRLGALPPTDLRADYKTRFQEFVQTHCKTVPTYRVTAMEGPDHDRRFTVEAWVAGELVGVGHADGKRRAEQLAARDGFRRMRDAWQVIPEHDSADLPAQRF